MKNDIDKIIVTNKSRLVEKYQAAGFRKVNAAVKKLIAADKKRGIDSILVFVDDVRTMQKVKGKKVKDHTSAQQNKNAIDALYEFYRPDYVLLLGSKDVIPHVRLLNPVWESGDHFEEEDFVNSDLPYAGQAPFSELAADFFSPSRVVGRLPNITNDTSPRNLIAVIENAIRAKTLPADAYSEYFALSTRTWKGSTQKTLEYIFRDNQRLRLAPPEPEKGNFTKKDLAPLVHFFNCHGGMGLTHFNGEKRGGDQSTAFQSSNVTGMVNYGTVVAAECCFGAELLHPEHKGASIPIGNNYLLNGALAYVGSTATAYGMSRTQGNADFLTEFFLKRVLKGSSIGRAFLEARQNFLAEAQKNDMDPYEMKTISQFILLGDPSVHPVEAAERNGKLDEDDEEKLIERAGNRHVAKKHLRRGRRISLAAASIMLDAISNPPIKLAKFRPTKNLHKTLIRVLHEYGFEGADFAGAFEYSRRNKNPELDALFENDYNVRLLVYKKGRKTARMESLVLKTLNSEIIEARKYLKK